MIKKLITAEQVIFHCSTYNTNHDVNYIHDSHIIAAQYGWLKPAVGEQMYEAMMADAHDFKRWTAAYTPATGDYVVNKYTDSNDTLQVGLWYVTLTPSPTGTAPQSTTAGYNVANFFCEGGLAGATSVYSDGYHNYGLEEALAWFTWAQAAPAMHNKGTGHGFMNDTPEGSEAIEQVRAAVQYAHDQGRLFLKMYLDYVRENTATLTLYSPELKEGKGNNGIVTYGSDKQIFPTDRRHSLWRDRDYWNDINCN